MNNRSVTLGSHFDNFVENLIKTGRFTSRSEILRAGLRMLEDEIERHNRATGKEKEF